jgi:hypothetical protein
LVLATALRVGSALYQGHAVAALPGVYDQLSYDELARRVADGHGFTFATGHWPATPAGEPTAHWSFLYTLLLAAAYALSGADVLGARLAQALLAGTLHTWLAWRIGERVFGRRAGLMTAGLTAVYAYFVYYAGALVTETLYIISVLWTLDVALRIGESRAGTDSGHPSRALGGRLWIELGLALGVTALLRQVFLLFVPFLYGWLWWRARTRSPGLRRVGRQDWSPSQGLLVATSITVVLIAPWTARNYRAFGTFVPLNTNAGFAFFWSNHPVYGTTYHGLLPSGAPGYYDLIPTELRGLNEGQLDKALLRRGLGFALQDPGRYLLLSISRTSEYFKFWPSRGSGRLSNVARIGSFGLCLPLIVYGLWLSGRMVLREHDTSRPPIVLLWSFVFIYTGIHLLSWALIRYRLPVDAVLLVFAGLALDRLTGRRVGQTGSGIRQVRL